MPEEFSFAPPHTQWGKMGQKIVELMTRVLSSVTYF